MIFLTIILNLFLTCEKILNMDRIYKSKIGWWYHLIIILAIAGCVHAFTRANVLFMKVMLSVSALILHVLFNTYYVITEDGKLISHCSFFPEKKISIHNIDAVEASSMPVHSYALSLDRIIIWTDGKPWMLVSPQNEKHFISALREFNPDIEIRN